jgi:RNA polymerase sigma factor (sigma-70 family)
MKLDASITIRDRIDDLYRSDSRRVFASLVRLNDFDLADDAMHDAYAAAVEVWQRDGVPANPRGWLISTGKFKAINAINRQRRLTALQPEIASRLDELDDENAARAATEIEDDRLRLIFTCCHPAIDPKLQVPLTLREVCGLTTEEIAHAFLTSKATMAQRIVRGKAKIRDEQIPYVVPSLGDLPERLAIEPPHERRLGQIHFGGDRLHPLRIGLVFQPANGGRIAGKRPVGKRVDLPTFYSGHGGFSWRTPWRAGRVSVPVSRSLSAGRGVAVRLYYREAHASRSPGRFAELILRSFLSLPWVGLPLAKCLSALR